MSQIVNFPVPTGRQAAVVGSISARASHANVADDIRDKWIAHAKTMLRAGHSAGWAISHCVKAMLADHRKAAEA